MVLEYGGYEYDAAPIDIYFAGEYWNNFSGAFNFALTAARHFGSERLALQLSRSPYSVEALSGIYAINLSLSGKHDVFSYIYSANFFQNVESGFMAHQSFGNSFSFGSFKFYFDLIHRLDMSSPTFFKDFSLVGNATLHASDFVDVFAKAVYDRNDSVQDPHIPVGTDLFKMGGGVELFPWKGHHDDLRIHCLYYHAAESALMIGLSCNLHILK